MPDINRKLSEKEKDFLKQAMQQMSPTGGIFAKKPDISVYKDKYGKIMEELDIKLGGNTYYSSALRPDFLVNLYHSYGTKTITDHTEEMKLVYTRLYNDMKMGRMFKTLFFITKYMKLSTEQKGKIEAALKAIAPSGYNNGFTQIAVSYEKYLKIIRTIDKKLGGGTQYGDMFRPALLQKPKTYEETLADYRKILDKDRFTNAYARYFADYMGITAGFFPIFITAFILTRDRRSRMHELVYSRGASSLTYAASKFAAAASAITLCYIPVTLHATWVYYRLAEFNGYPSDNLAFFKYLLVWIVPTIMFVTACGMLLSVLFGNGIAAIPLQFLAWMVSMLPLSGDYSLYKSVIRFNEAGLTDEYQSWLPHILLNRGFFIFVSFVLLILVSIVLSWKRGAVDGLHISRSKLTKVQH
jgi:hypothetical protein